MKAIITSFTPDGDGWLTVPVTKRHRGPGRRDWQLTFGWDITTWALGPSFERVRLNQYSPVAVIMLLQLGPVYFGVLGE